MIVQLVNKDGAPLAYLNKNAIWQFDTNKLLGVILGKCVFSQSGRPIGMLRHRAVRNAKGELIAMLSLQESKWSLAPTQDSSPVWEMIRHIKDHGCVLETKEGEWSNQPLEEVLS